MNQEVCINRILRDMKMAGLISEEANGEVKIYMNAAYVAGIEEGVRQGHANFKREIILCNPQGIQVDEFESIAEASRRRRVSIRTINNALYRSSTSRDGYQWRYKEKANC
jgi:hypothetical protein